MRPFPWPLKFPLCPLSPTPPPLSLSSLSIAFVSLSMAAEFPPNLDDGELWLPSVIFPDIGVFSRHDGRSSGELGSNLAQRLAASEFLDGDDRFTALKPDPRHYPNHKADGFKQGSRAWGFQRKPCPPSWFIPPVRLPGFVRESVGTGVFLPKVPFSNEVIKDSGMVKAEELKKMQPTYIASLKKNSDGLEPGTEPEPLANICLPQDWTY